MMCTLCYALSLHFLFDMCVMQLKSMLSLREWRGRKRVNNRKKKREKNVLQNERTFSSSTTFGICIFFANRIAIFLAFTRHQTDETQKYSKRTKRKKQQANNNNTHEENAGKQVERCCTMPFWCDAVYRLQAVNFQIDVCLTPNCCLGFVCIYIYFSTVQKGRRQRAREELS